MQKVAGYLLERRDGMELPGSRIATSATSRNSPATQPPSHPATHSPPRRGSMPAATCATARTE